MAATVTHMVPSRYDGFTTMPLGGHWRAGCSGKIVTDTDPWSGAILTEIPLAGADDLDDAYAVAERAQQAWAAQRPTRRADVMRAAASVLEARRDEVTDWLIHETGAPVAAAGFEWNQSREAILAAATLPHQVIGRIVPSDLPGRQTRVCRAPAGVVAVISPAHVLLARDNVASTREELTGPVITIVRAQDEQDALRIANETGYGRSSAVFTRDIERGTRVALGLNAAMTHVNEAAVNGDTTDDLSGGQVIGDLTAEHWVSVPLGAGP